MNLLIKLTNSTYFTNFKNHWSRFFLFVIFFSSLNLQHIILVYNLIFIKMDSIKYFYMCLKMKLRFKCLVLRKISDLFLILLHEIYNF